MLTLATPLRGVLRCASPLRVPAAARDGLGVAGRDEEQVHVGSNKEQLLELRFCRPPRVTPIAMTSAHSIARRAYRCASSNVFERAVSFAGQSPVQRWFGLHDQRARTTHSRCSLSILACIRRGRWRASGCRRSRQPGRQPPPVQGTLRPCPETRRVPCREAWRRLPSGSFCDTRPMVRRSDGQRTTSPRDVRRAGPPRQRSPLPTEPASLLGLARWSWPPTG